MGTRPSASRVAASGGAASGLIRGAVPGRLRSRSGPFRRRNRIGARNARRKASGEVIDVDTESFYNLDVGDVYELQISGGGGYGDPKRRPVEKVQDDVRNGLVSVQAARDLYGVVIDPETIEVDSAATGELRG